MTERDKTREERKAQVLESFSEGKKLYTNHVAKQIGVVWPVADRLLRELVAEGRLSGSKGWGYTLPEKQTLWRKIREVLHV